MIDASLLASLKKSSEKRIQKDAVLQMTLKEVQEDQESGEVVLGEYRKKITSNPKFGDDEANEQEFETQKGAFIDEAVNIVVDMIQLKK